MKILITDVHTRKGFDTVSILLQHYSKEDLLLAAPKDTAIQLKLVYGCSVHNLSKDSVDAFHASLSRILQAAGDEAVYLPVEEDTTLLLYSLLETTPLPGLRHMLPTAGSFALARDKDAVAAFAQELDLPIPERFTADKLPDLAANFRPVVAKPRQGTGSAGLHFIESPEELSKLDGLDLNAYIIQEKIPDSHAVEGGFFLFDNGAPVGYYGHQRIRTYPVKGGVTVYSRLEFNPEIEQLGNTLLTALSWSGLAMVEYLHDPVSNQYKLIEVNPRLWGSILLSEKAESNFLPNYVRLASGGSALPQIRPAGPRFIRWLFPFDLLNLVRNPKSVPDFWKFNRKATCYIGFSYSSWGRSIAFLIYQTFNFSSVGKFFKKLRG